MAEDDAGGACAAGTCDIFDFMAQHLGLAVLHPGGPGSTEAIAERCGLGAGARVLDMACGKGGTAAHLAKTYGCRVTGVDIDTGCSRLPGARRSVAAWPIS